MKKILFLLLCVFISASVFSVNLFTADEINTLSTSSETVTKSVRGVDICANKNKKVLVKSSETTSFVNPGVQGRWTKTDRYYFSFSSSASISVSLGYGPVSVSYSPSQNGGGWSVPADIKKFSQPVMWERGPVYKKIWPDCNSSQAMEVKDQWATIKYK